VHVYYVLQVGLQCQLRATKLLQTLFQSVRIGNHEIFFRVCVSLNNEHPHDFFSATHVTAKVLVLVGKLVGQIGKAQ